MGGGNDRGGKGRALTKWYTAVQAIALDDQRTGTAKTSGRTLVCAWSATALICLSIRSGCVGRDLNDLRRDDDRFVELARQQIGELFGTGTFPDEVSTGIMSGATSMAPMTTAVESASKRLNRYPS